MAQQHQAVHSSVVTPRFSEGFWKIQAAGLILMAGSSFFPPLYHWQEYGFFMLVMPAVGVMIGMRSSPWVRTAISCKSISWMCGRYRASSSSSLRHAMSCPAGTWSSPTAGLPVYGHPVLAALTRGCRSPSGRVKSMGAVNSPLHLNRSVSSRAFASLCFRRALPNSMAPWNALTGLTRKSSMSPTRANWSGRTLRLAQLH
jgi:hypothetical protein